MMKKCPKCGSRRVAPILFGMPAFDDEMEQRLKSEQLYLGGCCVSDHGPQYHCFECSKDVGSPPILFSKCGDEDYRDIVTSVRFNDGGYFGGYDEVTIKKQPLASLRTLVPISGGNLWVVRELSRKKSGTNCWIDYSVSYMSMNGKNSTMIGMSWMVNSGNLSSE